MKLKTLSSTNLAGKTVLYRAPYDIDVEEKEGTLVPVDDMRIKATVPTLQYLLKENCKIVILYSISQKNCV